MRKLLAVVLPLAAAVVAGCGTDTKSCSTKPANLVAENPVQRCTTPPGATVNIGVRLCGACTDSSPSCTAEYRNGIIEIDPIFRECAEDQGCQLGGGCDIQPSTTCTVTLPSNVSGSIPVVLAANATQVSEVTVGGSSSCAFALTAGANVP